MTSRRSKGDGGLRWDSSRQRWIAEVTIGHSGTTTTETVYRKQIHPVIVQGADAMDRIFPTEDEYAHSLR
jgi:hypothetical protein